MPAERHVVGRTVGGTADLLGVDEHLPLRREIHRWQALLCHGCLAGAGAVLQAHIALPAFLSVDE